ncbi:PREDICTED: solute carrier family 25 member 40 [Thamnophis sirtalis]|uniref:Solute carrier family 25 member 40 n=1 Tax=Thamnophis sirtalis TaxID=35019 RepID=A0A6I9XSD6_9SAUR|nr:PREDICTED: solute carrier family 25 member 40 [Thamnophis sirtalis]
MFLLSIIPEKFKKEGKSFLDSDGLTDHIYLYENGTGKTWNKTSARFTGMLDAFAKIVQREGVKALWSGLPPSLAVSVPTTVIYFTCYDQLRDALVYKLGENDYIPLIAGAIARLCSATIISPIEMIRTRIQSGRLTYTQLLARISTDVTQYGWLSLWKGWGPTILRDVPFSVTLFAFWPLNIYEYFSLQIAATLTLPFDVIKTYRQTELWELDITQSPQKKTRSIWEVMKRIVIENGFTGLFTGIIPRLTKIAPACAIMISTYEYGKTFFRRLNKDKDMKNY